MTPEQARAHAIGYLRAQAACVDDDFIRDIFLAVAQEIEDHR